ncbi:MAG: MFS transporter [Akkermansiaceae bacterium]|nr:MFS transporter [Akkermansiaceae bacterium]
MASLKPKEKRAAAWIITAQSATRLGDVLTNPKTVLTWLLSALGAPGALLSLLVPVRESGSMLPQVVISDWVKRVERRKWIFVAGAVAQAMAIAAMGLAAWKLPPAVASGVVLVALAAFAVARSFCSVSSKDVLGRSVPKGFRGRVSGTSNAISGVLSAAAAVSLIFAGGSDLAAVWLAQLVLGASLLWVLGAAFYSLVAEPRQEGKRDQGRQGWSERLSMVREDPKFRDFVVARGLLLGTALASPLLVILSQRSGAQLGSLAGFIIAAGVAKAGSSFFWGKLADRSGALSMAVGGLVAAVIGILAITLAFAKPGNITPEYAWPLLFLVFNIGYAGVRLGRKTWVVDAADGDQRTDYVSASNTLIAVLILITGLIHSPLQAWSPLASLGLYVLLCLAGVGAAWRLQRYV